MAREGKPEKNYRSVIERQTQRLLERGDVARHDEPGQEYFHRPGELLVALERVDELRDPLAEMQAERIDAADELGVATYRLSDNRTSVHDSALRLQEAARDPGAAGPHHVLFGVPYWHASPGRPPFPGAPVDLSAQCGDGDGAVIAVVDTGQAQESLQLDWMRDHVDVGPDDVDLLDVDNDNAHELDFEAGHGTFISGVIAQVAPGAKVLARRALDTWGVTDELTVAKQIRRAVSEGANIVNLSLGGYSQGDFPPLAVSRALQRQDGDNEVVFVAAAGNDGIDRPFFPAALDNVIAVAALGSSHRRAGFSNFGPWVDASADGERLLSVFVRGTVMTDSDGDGIHDHFKEPWAYWSGTSFAAPQVAAAIAVRMSTHGETASQAAHALVGDSALPRRTGLGVQIRTGVLSHPARVGLP